MEQEGRADQRDDDDLRYQLAAQVVDGALDQRGAVVGLDNFYTRRQAAGQLVEARTHPLDGRARVLAAAHDDNGADYFALAVELGNATTHLRPEPQLGDVGEQHRHAAGHLERQAGEIIETLDVARGAHHVLRLRHLDDRAAGLGIAPLHGHAHVRDRQPLAAQADRVQHHLVLLHHAADRRHFRNPGNGLQLKLKEPVLQAPQLRQVVATTSIHQRVLVDPADPSGVGAKRGPHAGRQAR